jgi:hypothetical protein
MLVWQGLQQSKLTRLELKAKKKRNNEVVRVTYKCNRQGKQDTSKEGNTQEEEINTERETNVMVKTDCKYCMVVSERKGVWVVTRLDLEHNHPMHPRAKYLRAHKDMTEQEKKMIRTLNECNIPTKQMMYLLSHLQVAWEQHLTGIGTSATIEVKSKEKQIRTT